jgi:hypothetical protein
VETAWAAGLFEGEGAATFCGGRARLALKMTSEASVRRFHAAIGAGKVYGPYGPYQPNRTPFFMWVVEGDEARDVALCLRPMLSGTPRERVDAWLTT